MKMIKNVYELKPLLNRCKCNEYEPIENFFIRRFFEKIYRAPLLIYILY